MTGLLCLVVLAAPPPKATPPPDPPPAAAPDADAAPDDVPPGETPLSGPLPLSLDEARQLALTRSYVLKQRALQTEELGARVKEAEAAIWPRVNLSASYTRTLYTPNPFAGSGASGILGGLFSVGWLEFNERARTDADPMTNPITLQDYLQRYNAGQAEAGITPPDNPFLVENQFVLGASLTQTIYNGAAFAAMRGAEALLEQTQADQEADALRVIDQVGEAYLRVLLANAQVEVLEKSLSRVADALVETRARVKQGTIPQFAQLTAEVEQANLQTQRVQAIDGARQAREALALTIGLPPDRALRLTDRLLPPDDTTLPTFADAYQQALANRPDLAALRRALRTAQVQVELAEAAFLPLVEAFIDASYIGRVPDNRTIASQDAEDPFRFNTRENSFFDDSYWNANVTAGIRLNWLAFDGFARSARAEQSEVAVRRVRTQDAQLRDQVRLEVLAGLRSLQTARQRLITQERNIARAELNYEHAEARVGEGVSTRAELREASAQLDQSRFNHLQAIHDYHRARMRLEIAMGTRPGGAR